MGIKQSKDSEEYQKLLTDIEKINEPYDLEENINNKFYLKDYIEMNLLINKMKYIFHDRPIAYYNTLDQIEFLPYKFESSKQREMYKEAIYYRIIFIENYTDLNDLVCLIRQLKNKIKYDEDKYLNHILSLGTFYKLRYIKFYAGSDNNSSLSI